MRRLIFNILKYITIFTSIMFVVIGVIYLYDINLYFKTVMINESNTLSIIGSKIQNKIISSVGDLMVLSRNPFLMVYFKEKDELNREYLNHLFSLVMNERKLYDQIRFLDNDGEEIVRANYENGGAVTIPVSQLQNKKRRYYFQDTIKLDERDIYVSPLDLNIENGVIELPLKPMIRLATPVFDGNIKRGILILNYYGSKIINDVDFLHREIEQDHQKYNDKIYFVNSDSYWFNHSDNGKNWGFMYPDKKEIHFKSEFPAEWDVISGMDQGQFRTENGLFTYETIYPLLEAWKASKGTADPFGSSEKLIESNEYFWKIIDYIPKRQLIKIRNEILIKYLSIFFIMFIILAIISYLLAVNEKKRKIAQEELQKTIVSLDEANNLKDKFFSIIAHDLKNPFTGIIGFSEMLKNDVDTLKTDKIKQITTLIHTSARTAMDLLDNLLTWARLQMNRLPIERTNINLKTMIDLIIALFGSAALDKNISLTSVITDEIFCYADEFMLNTIFRNLISNAIKFTPEGGVVTISHRLTGDHIELLVTDNGTGIQEKDISKLFRIDSSFSLPGTNNEHGTGLGLILCKEFVEKNNGTLTVESEYKKGTIFTVTIEKSAV